MAVVFPADIVAEILSRMPVKQLLRYRSVCKTWFALIDSDHFSKLHLHRSIDHRKIVLPTDRCVHLFSIDSLDVAEKIDLPLVVDADYVSFPDSCNGLVLLCTSHDSAFWNPSTRTCQVIPRRRPTPKSHLYEEDAPASPWYPFKLGYDVINDDYKVVKFSQFKYYHSNAVVSNFQVYSMKSNSWRTVFQDYPYCICYKRQQGRDVVLSNGALHWCVGINNDDDGFAIVAFHLSTETARLVPLPDLCGRKDLYMDLVDLEGCLSIVAYVRTFHLFGSFIGVWVLNDYGVGETWNQLISPPQLSVIGWFYKVLPLAYSKNGSEVLLLRNNNELIWFDLQHNAVRKIKVQGLPSYFEAKVFVQNLLRLGPGGKIIPEDKKIGMKRNRGAIEP